MLQKLKTLVRRCAVESLEIGREIAAPVVRLYKTTRDSIKRDAEEQRAREPEVHEARERDKQEAREGLRQATDDMKKAWADLPPWPLLMPAILLLVGFAALIVWVLTSG